MTPKNNSEIKRILVPLDGSDLAEQALPYAEALGRKLQSRLDLYWIIEPLPPGLADIQHGDYPHRVSDSIASHAKDYLENTAGPLRREGLQVNTMVSEGEPAPLILDEAARDPDTLIAMCTHGRSGITRWAAGSVTDKVLHAATCPLLIVQAGAAAAAVDLETLIVPLDGSELAEQTLPQVVTLARALGLRVVLVRVTPSAEEYHRYMSATPIAAGVTVYSGPYEEFAKEADARAMQYLHGVSQDLAEQHLVTVEEVLRRGHPAEAIAEVAREVPNSLLVMTTHGRSGVSRWLLGSVTDRVVRHSGMPVLVVRASE